MEKVCLRAGGEECERRFVWSMMKEDSEKVCEVYEVVDGWFQFCVGRIENSCWEALNGDGWPKVGGSMLLVVNSEWEEMWEVVCVGEH